MQVSHNTVRKTNIYECTIDQELATRAPQTLRVHSPGASTFLHKLRYGRHLEIMTSYTKCGSVNRCRTILPNFTQIRLESTGPLALKKIAQQEQQQQ